MAWDRRRTFEALDVPAYRTFALSQLVSITGTVVQGVGTAWLVLRLDGGGVELGLVAAAQFTPLLLFGPLAGVVADRHDKRRLLLVTQSGMATVAALLALLTVTERISLAGLAVLVLLQGCFGALDAPTRGALVPQLVGPALVANAVSLHEVWINTARIVGPLLGGTVIAIAGVGACFVLNSASFIPGLAAVWLLPHQPSGPVAGRHRAQLAEGLRYAWQHRGIRSLLVLAAAVGAFFNFGVVLPLLAVDTFDAGHQALGGMISAVGAGAVLGSLVLAAAGPPTPRRLDCLGVTAGACFLASAAAPTLAVELVVLAAAGAAGVCLVAAANALLQLRCDPAVRGRLLALWGVALVGSSVLSGPLVGTVAAGLGPRAGMGAIGLAVLVAVVLPRRTFRTDLAVPTEGATMPSLDCRTKRHAAVRAITIDQIVSELGPAVSVAHGDLAARAQERLDLPPLVLEVDGRACTVDAGTIRPGAVDDGLRVTLGPEALTALIAGLSSCQGVALGAADVPRDAVGSMAAWDIPLRALLDGRPLHEPGDISLDHLDVERTFNSDDDDADIASFLVDAGFLRLQGWIDPGLLGAIEADVAAAAHAARPGQPHRWWATMDDGTERCIRVMYLLEISPTMAELVESEPYQRLGRLFHDGHRRFPDRPQSSEALIKPAGVVKGVADVPWHRDCSLGGHEYGCAGYAIGLPLSATSRGTGHLRVIPGSHRVAMPNPGTAPGYTSGLEALDVFTEPGDLTVHVGCTFHATRPPRSGERTVTYTTFSLPEHDADELAVDAVLPDADRAAAAGSAL